jgi:hypothetical protein
MSVYKEASMLKLRFTTQVGVLSVEQLWDLTQSQLSTTIKNVKKVLTKDNDDELSFLETNNVVDKENQLRFDILKDIYLTKKSEQERLRNIAETKEFNKKIDTLIAMKKESQLQEMTIEELEKLRK